MNDDTNNNVGNNDVNTDNNQSNTDNNSTNGEGIDAQAFADIISEKDKELEQMRQEIAELKKSNANLIVKVNAAANPPEQKKSFEENLLNMVGGKPRKE